MMLRLTGIDITCCPQCKKAKWYESENCQSKTIWIHPNHYIGLDAYSLRLKICYQSTIERLRTFSAIDVYTNMIQPSYQYFQPTYRAPKGLILHFIRLATVKPLPSLKTFHSMPST
jgi:hypothetical protein